MRDLGLTQCETATIVGVTERTIRNWEKHPSWQEAIQAARRITPWHIDIVKVAQRTVLRAIAQGDVELAWRVLEPVFERANSLRYGLSSGDPGSR
jgi:DNA-binding XRE family transcriptional regulator